MFDTNLFFYNLINLKRKKEIGVLIAGYLYPNKGKELSDAVEDFEKK